MNIPRSLSNWTAVSQALVALAATALGIVTASCDALPRNEPAPSGQDKYQLMRDGRGSVIRLDKATGEMWLVEGVNLTPLKPTGGGNAPLAGKSPPPTKAVPPETPTRTANTEASRTAVEALPGQMITITATASVFVSPNRNQTPLIVAAPGSTFSVRGTEGDWYYIEFNDARWGTRVGYVSKRDAAVVPAEKEPVDLSIPELKNK